jgi:hypothetical protein
MGKKSVTESEPEAEQEMNTEKEIVNSQEPFANETKSQKKKRKALEKKLQLEQEKLKEKEELKIPDIEGVEERKSHQESLSTKPQEIDQTIEPTAGGVRTDQELFEQSSDEVALLSTDQLNVPEENYDLPPSVDDEEIEFPTIEKPSAEIGLMIVHEEVSIPSKHGSSVEIEEEIPLEVPSEHLPAPDETDALTPIDKGFLTVSPEKFRKQSSFSSSETSINGVSYFIRSSLLLAHQFVTHLREILVFLDDELKYEFGIFSKESVGPYSPFLHTWLIPHFIHRNPSLRMMDSMIPNGDESVTTDGVDNQIITEFSQNNSLVDTQQTTPTTTSSPISSVSSAHDLSISTSEFLLLMALSDLLMACTWTYLLFLFTLSHSCLSTIITKSLSLCWFVCVTVIHSMIWLFLLPITIPLSLCKKMVLYFFPDLKKNSPQQGVPHSVFGTL